MPAVTWLDVVKSELAKAPGKSVKDVVPAARKEWNLIKSGKHPTKTQGKMVIKRKKSSKKYPKKGMRSKTRRGRLDYETHKGDKFFHRKKHLVKRKRKPFTKKHKGGNKGLRGIVSDVGDKLSSLGGNDTSTTESMDPTATNDADNTSHQNDHPKLQLHQVLLMLPKIVRKQEEEEEERLLKNLEENANVQDVIN